MAKLGALQELAAAIQRALRYSGYRGANKDLAGANFERSAQLFVPSTNTREVADSFNSAYDRLAELRVPKKLIAPRRSGQSIVTESDISRAMDEGSNAFGLRITPGAELNRHALAETIGEHYSPPERVDQLKPFIRRYKNEGFTEPRITAVHHRITTPLDTDDDAAEVAAIQASRLGNNVNSLYSSIAAGWPQSQQAEFMTKALEEAGIDALIYDNWIEGVNNVSSKPLANWINRPVYDDLKGWVRDGRIAPTDENRGVGLLNPSVAAIKPLKKLKRGGLVQYKESCSKGNKWVP